MPKSFIDKDKLSELWKKGFTASQIAMTLGCKSDSVYKLAHRMGLTRHKTGHKTFFELCPDKKKWFIRNYPEMSNSTISAYLGLSEDYIGVLARRLGLKKSETYWDGIKEYQRKRVRQFHDSKKGDKEYYSYNKRKRDTNGKFIKLQRS